MATIQINCTDKQAKLIVKLLDRGYLQHVLNVNRYIKVGEEEELQEVSEPFSLNPRVVQNNLQPDNIIYEVVFRD